MNPRFTRIAEAFQTAFRNVFGKARNAAAGLQGPATAGLQNLHGSRRTLITLGVAGLAAWALIAHPPLQTVSAGEVGVRTNQLTGHSAQFGEGTVLVMPALHHLRSFSLRDQIYRPEQGRMADGKAAFQSVEGLSLGLDLAVRYAFDPARTTQMARLLPQDIAADVLEPAVQGVIYKVLTRYTVREIFSAKRVEIQQAIESDLRVKLAADGIVLKGVQIGKVDLPPEYRQGMDRLLAEELNAEKMQYTLALKEKQVRQSELEAQAEKVRRETSAAAAASEEVIAARAQEEAMRHVLPFKQKQIEQRQFEAEAEKVARVKQAEASAQARRIEAAGEADSRQKLADAEAYRMDRVGRIASEQMAREGVLLSRHPLLIQKTMADKLADKVQVIVAPPGTDGRLFAGLIGSAPAPEVQPVQTTTPEGEQ